MSAVVLVTVNCLLATWLAVKPASHARIVAVDDIMQSAGPLLGVLLYLLGSWRLKRVSSHPGPAPRGGRAQRLAPPFLALGALCFAIGQAIWAFYELVLHQPTPFPSLADAGYLMAYPFFFVGVFLLPVRRTSLASRSRLLLEGLLILVAVVTFSWYFILGPTLLQDGETILARVVGTAYPTCDLVLVFGLLLLSAHARDPVMRSTIRVLSAGLAMIVVTDSIFDYQTLHGTYATGGLVDVGWPLGYMLIALGALAARLSMAEEGQSSAEAEAFAEEASQPRLWHTLAPYGLVPAVAALMVYAGHVRGDEKVEPGVFVGGAVLIALVLVRQLLVILENRQLYRAAVANAARLQAAEAELRANNRALAEANTRLESLATTDPLTNLPNHRAVVAAIDHELERAHRYNRSFALLFIDIDHFKSLNDGCGHSAGDAALREFAAVVQSALRGSDVLGRWGGEEFVVILPETDPDGAAAIAERLRALVAGHPLSLASGPRLTCSIGVAHFPFDVRDREGLIEMADRAMYAAKRLGRNQVRLTGDPAVAALADEAGQAGTREEAALVGTVEALASLVQARDRSTGHHIAAVSTLSTELGHHLGLSASDVSNLTLAAWLHDIGKVAVPDSVLQKPARLTEEEWAVMRTHPVVGAEVTGHVPGLRLVAPVIRAHHERWDGRGYPDGLAREQIPLLARIIAVADAYSTMIAERPYRHARSAQDARAELQRCAGSQFDPAIVQALLDVLDRNLTLQRAS
ncbi:MAG: diguanylate cyclase [Chloroflexi bacterium]|nr:diguanylate cyclase [Chloroflexota bacterium]